MGQFRPCTNSVLVILMQGLAGAGVFGGVGGWRAEIVRVMVFGGMGQA